VIFDSSNLSDCATAMIRNAWKAIYDYCCGN